MASRKLANLNNTEADRIPVTRPFARLASNTQYRYLRRRSGASWLIIYRLPRKSKPGVCKPNSL